MTKNCTNRQDLFLLHILLCELFLTIRIIEVKAKFPVCIGNYILIYVKHKICLFYTYLTKNNETKLEHCTHGPYECISGHDIFLAKISTKINAAKTLQWPQVGHCSYFCRKFLPPILSTISPLLYKNHPFSTRHRQKNDLYF